MPEIVINHLSLWIQGLFVTGAALRIMWCLFAIGRNYDERHKETRKIKNIVAATIIAVLIINFADVIIKIFPHEQTF